MLLDLFRRRNRIEDYRELIGRRYETFHRTFELFLRQRGKVVVELGTSRSFVPGGVEGCMINDPRYWNPDDPTTWDWGSGLFTRLCAHHLGHRKPIIHSVDISTDALEISRVICEPYLHLVQYHQESSEDFLQRFAGPIDLLYMDAGEADEGAEELHVREARIVVERQLVPKKGLVLVDDVDMPEGYVSKGEKSIPYLVENGYEILVEDYQVLLQRVR